ncbi:MULTISPECIES: transposase [unclassified Streptomyces]|uniref:transposase n=1 Tax=Streptomyces sp. Ag109_G2-15 TaxID=1938850 RepID=UPI000BCC16E0|nr:Putative transposase of IS4/5 family [Streptomyces sp. Ag109_G2-15]
MFDAKLLPTTVRMVAAGVALPIPKMGRPPPDLRQVFDGNWWRERTGSPWRDVPERYELSRHALMLNNFLNYPSKSNRLA